MNLAFIAPRYGNSFWSSLGRCVYSFAQGLSDMGHSITVYTFNSTQVTKKYKDNSVKVVSIGGVSSDSSKLGLMFEDVEKWNASVKDEVHSERYDAILCFDWFGFAVCQRIQSMIKIQYLMEVPIIGVINTLANGRGQYVPFSNQEKVEQYLAKELEFLETCNSLIAFNRGSAFEAKKISQTECHLIELGAEPVEIERKIDPGKVIVMGRISRERCLERAVRVTAEHSWISLEICGTGIESRYGLYIKDLTKRLNVTDRVSFLGWMEDAKAKQLYGTAEIVLCPSIYDPFGYAALDAMSFGIPVVASYESYRGIVEHKQTGMLFQSLPELTSALEELHSDKALKDKLVNNAREELKGKRSLKVSIESLHQKLIEMIATESKDLLFK